MELFLSHQHVYMYLYIIYIYILYCFNCFLFSFDIIFTKWKRSREIAKGYRPATNDDRKFITGQTGCERNTNESGERYNTTERRE